MAYTRTQLRRLLAQDIGGEHYALGTVASSPAGDAHGWYCAEFIDLAADRAKLRDRWVYVPSAVAAGDRERRLIDWNPEDGLVVPHRPLSTAHTATWEVELHRYQPSLLNQAINDGLARCFYRDEVDITIVQNQTEYDLSAHTFLTHPRQFIGAMWEGTNTVMSWEELQWARVVNDGGTLFLRIAYPWDAGSGRTLILVVKRPFGPLNADGDSVTIHEMWARTAAQVSLYDILIPRTSAAKEQQRLIQNRALALQRFRHYAQNNQPTVSRKTTTSTPTWRLWPSPP